jgi:hypothetical protein
VKNFKKEFEEDGYGIQWEFRRQLREECIMVKFIFNISGVRGTR